MSDKPLRLACRGVQKFHFSASGHAVHALNDINIEVYDGEFVCIVGSSGSGKSTLLRILAGLDQPDSGTVELHAKGDRNRIGFLFQNDSIFPWFTVARNLGYSLEARGIPLEQRQEQVEDLCRTIGLSPEKYLQKYPRELSGGEVRRVGIGIALSARASLLLLDEPTSQLDYLSRLELQQVIRKISQMRKSTVVCVTHDIDEAIMLGQRILVLGAGKILDTIPVNIPFTSPDQVSVSAEALAIRRRIIAHLKGEPQ